MKTRARQREETRDRIVAAAVKCFSEKGFWGASTREIASRAGTNQGLITYHFRSKDDLWKAAANHLFARLAERMGERLAALGAKDRRAQAREVIREFVRFNAAHPELFRFMVEQGSQDDPRMRWLIDTHVQPLYDQLPDFGGARGDETRKAHAYYVLVGAGSILFAVAPECRRLTGLDPSTPEVVEAHADFVAELLVP